jgi:quaternary ammonium compound-resistance protein SugE
MNAWIHLLIAGLTEIGWAVGLKVSEGWTRFWPSVATVGLILISYVFLSLALKSLPLGTAYAVWTGIGAAGTAVVGMLYFHEPRSPLRVLCIGFITLVLPALKCLRQQRRSKARAKRGS